MRFLIPALGAVLAMIAACGDVATTQPETVANKPDAAPQRPVLRYYLWSLD